ncbi:MAG: DNA-binding protein [Candidatus Saccharibacteria bacterium]
MNLKDDADGLTGRWRSFYRYPSEGRGGEDFWGQHTLVATQAGDTLHLESEGSPSHVVMDLSLGSGDMVRGTWREETDPAGYYHGEVYEGTIELEVAEDGQRMNGTWHGAGRDGKINSDIWELTREGAEQQKVVEGKAGGK